MTSSSERGSTSVLVLGLALVVFAISGLAVDGTRAFIFHRSLQAAADGAALAAASELDTDAYYASGGNRMRLSETARAVAGSYVRARGVPAHGALDISRGSVTLRLSGSVRTSFLGLVGIDELRVAAEATARPVRGGVGP